MTTATTPKQKRHDADVARLRAVKNAAKKLAAAQRARTKADERCERANKELEAALNAAPEEQRAYLRSVVGL